MADSQSRYSEQEKLPGASSARVSFEKTILKKVYVVFFCFQTKTKIEIEKNQSIRHLREKTTLHRMCAFGSFRICFHRAQDLDSGTGNTRAKRKGTLPNPGSSVSFKVER